MNYPVLTAFANKYLEGATLGKTPEQLIKQTAEACPYADLDLVEQDLSNVITDDGGDVEAFIDTVVGEGDIYNAGGSTTSDAFIAFMAEMSVCP